MAHGTEHHLEHAEHAAHGGHGGHGEHGEHGGHDPFNARVAMTMAIVAAVLACVTMLSHRSHNETLRLQSEANIHHTQASDQWSYYQAKKNRQYMNELDADMMTMMAASGDERKQSSQAVELAADWKKKAKTYKKDSEKIEEDAKHLVERAEELQEESHKVHEKSTRFDLSELGVEMALVLCSIAVLTKQRGFWYSGIGFGVLGVIVALTGLFGLGLH
jgi:hypothetical protein